MISAKHYELAGYAVKLVNPNGNQLRVKLTTRGDPWNFSRFELQKGGLGYEIHSNLPVVDALGTPGARYVVDVAVVKAGCVPKTKGARAQPKWSELKNEDLITFIEAKALVIYPMLIAQFIGIVHELQPRFLSGRRPRHFVARNHFDPALVSLGYLHGTCLNIVKGLGARNCRIGIVAEFDRSIKSLNFGGDSPLSLSAQRKALKR
ncbi:MAG: hypothetical protein WBF71_05065 [Microthrixaceae bacterium]